MIRPYRNSDKEQLIEIFKLNTPEFFDPKEVRDFEEYLSQYADTYLTIESEGKIVGGTGYRYSTQNTVGHITWIFFHPEAAGKGLGKQAVVHCHELFKLNLALQKVVVTTSQLAYKFFEKFGYTLTRKEKDHWGPGLDLYQMERKWA